MSGLSELFSKKGIRHATVGSVMIKFGSAFFTFLNSILLARLLSLEGFGYYVIAFSTVMLLSVPTTLGIPYLITRYVSKYEVHGNYRAIKGLLIKTNTLVLITTLTIFVIAAISYFFWWGSYESELVETMLYALMLVPVLGFGALRNAALRGMKLIILAELPDALIRNAIFTVLIVGCMLLDNTLTPQNAMLMHVIAGAVAFVLGFIFLRRKLWSQIQGLVPEFHSREWIKQTIPFSINSGVFVVKSKSLVYLLAIFGSVEAVALFEVAMRAASLVSFVMDALNLAISPFISSAFEKGRIGEIQRVVTRTSRIIFLFALPVALAFFIGGKPLLALVFGEVYKNSYVPLVILCGAQLLSAVVGSVGLVLSMTGKQGLLSKSNLIAMAAILVFSIPLIRYFDVTGAALIFGCILIIQNLFLLYYVRKHIQVNTTIF